MKGKDLRKLEEKLINYQGEDRVVSFQEMNEELSESTGSSVIFRSGLSRLDDLVGGFEPGELIVVSGRPKSGKTLFLQSLTQKFDLEKVPSLWFSYELPPRQFLRCFEDLPDAYMPRRMELADLGWLEQRIWEAKLKYGLQIVMIDHLHYLVDMSRLRNPSLEIGTVARKLKCMAIEHNQLIFLIWHTSKIRRGEEPQGEDIRDSSFALQEPDTVLMLWRVANRDDEIGNQARLKVVMTRRTGVIERTIKVEKVGDRLVELEEHQNENWID